MTSAFSRATPEDRRLEAADFESQLEDNGLDLEGQLEKGLDDFLTDQLTSEFSTPKPVAKRTIVMLGNATGSSAQSSQTRSQATSDEDDSESQFSIGSLMEFKGELIKTLKRSIKELESETSSNYTDTSEYYSVFENSDLRVRGIDVDNLQDHKGKKFGIYDLFKARFQQASEGNKSIKNQEVIGLLGRIMKHSNEKSAASFMNKENDYKKGNAPEGSNWRVFFEHWKDNKNRRQCN